MESPPDLVRAPSRLFSRGLTWSAVWAVLAVLHVTQAIWLSRGREVPGDLADGRFNQLILEHGYQSLRGVYVWASPSQFFPQKNTLAYSDTHAGTLPIYATLRASGLSMERALQGWFVVVAGLNVFAALRLFASLGIARSVRGPLVFSATSSAVLVWLAGVHMQLLPFFPTLLLWTQLVRWLRDRRGWRLVAAGGWFAWQFAAAPYLAFFAAVLTLTLGAIYLVLAFFCGPLRKGPVRDLSPPSKLAALTIALVGGLLAAAAGEIYSLSAGLGITRSMTELVALAPMPASWFIAPPVHAWWPTPATAAGENEWLAGLLPFVFLPVILWLGWKRRREMVGAGLLAIGVGTLATMIFFTQWGTNGPSAWLFAAGHVPPLRAFRACGRIAPLIFLLLVAAVGLVLTRWRVSARGRWRRALPALIAVLVAGETLAHHQPGMNLANAEARARAVIVAWKAAGDRPVLAYAFGYVNQPPPWLHLDAWSAALRLQRSTINGYTGGVPSSVWSFIWNPTVDNARAAIAQNGVDPAEVSIVDHLPPADEAAIGLERRTHLPTVTLQGFQLQPVSWSLFGPLERFDESVRIMYQFTPPATVEFTLPDTATTFEYNQEMRDGSYNGSGHSDGVGITWAVKVGGQNETVVWQELLDPGHHPGQRGIIHRSVTLPSGTHRTLILRTDDGPNGDGRWDWPLFGELKIH